MKTILFSFLLFPLLASADAKHVLLVLTNHSQLGDTGKKTGFYLSEAAHPYEVFTNEGMEVTLASPDGGFAPLDPSSLDLDDKRNAVFWKKFGNANPENPGVPDTTALPNINLSDYAAIFFAGGHGAMWDLPDSEVVQSAIRGIYQRGGAVGAVCHGPAALVNVRLEDGTHLLADKKTAVFTNSEEEAVGLTEVVPFLLQDSFEKAGATVRTAEDFSQNAVRDGRLVTGQNPASATRAAELLVEAVRKEKS